MLFARFIQLVRMHACSLALLPAASPLLPYSSTLPYSLLLSPPPTATPLRTLLLSLLAATVAPVNWPLAYAVAAATAAAAAVAQHTERNTMRV